MNARNPFNDFVFIGATPSDRGSFSVALERALDKLEKFQLPESAHFVLQWMQALVAAKATHVKVRIEETTRTFQTSTTITFTFDGPGYEPRELEGLYDHVFLSGRNRNVDRLRELSLGWLSASSMNPEKVRIASRGFERVRLKAGSRLDETCARFASAPGKGEESPEHVLEFQVGRSFPWENLLLQRCGDIPIRLTVNGESINDSGVGVGVPWPNRRFKRGNTQGVVGATYGDSATSQLTFLRYGINFVSRPEPSLLPPVMLRIEDSTLSKNVSQTDVVRDEAYERFIERVRLEMLDLAVALTGTSIPGYQRESLNRYLQAYLGSHLDPRVFHDTERLSLLGEDFKRLVEFPVFRSSGGSYRSLAEVYQVYSKRGCVLYCSDSWARSVDWEGLLLILESEEAELLKKFCPNLIELSATEIRWHSRQEDQERTPPAAFQRRHLLRRGFHIGTRTLAAALPDVYPSGEVNLIYGQSQQRVLVPGLRLTLDVTDPANRLLPPDEFHRIPEALKALVPDFLELLARQLNDFSPGEEFAKIRRAELYCELLNFQIEEQQKAARDPEGILQGEPTDLLERLGLPKDSGELPLIGLENGQMASLKDLTEYHRAVDRTFIGGAFLQGLDSGAIDPMPQARKLLVKVFGDSAFTPIERYRPGLSENKEIQFELRRQTLICGLGRHPAPDQAVANFAKEAERERLELQRLENEYRRTLAGSELFIAPEAERLELLREEVADSSEALSFDLLSDSDSEPTDPEPTPMDSVEHTRHQSTPLTPLETEITKLRSERLDLLTDPFALHVERREFEFDLHLGSLAPNRRDGAVFIIQQSSLSSATVELLPLQLPIDGVVRVRPGIDPEPILRASIEQLVIRGIDRYTNEMLELRRRQRLRDWLLTVCCLDIPQLLASTDRRDGLFDLALLPTLGGKRLSWRAAWSLYQQQGQLAVWTEGSPVEPCPNREVLHLTSPLSEQVLVSAGFQNLHPWHPQDAEASSFEALFQSAQRDLSSLAFGSEVPLLHPRLLDRLADDAGLWRRWRSGFLSWDAERSVAILNPSHRLAKSLAARYDADPSWSLVFASALYSTINRGLEEVEDDHERILLERLVDSYG